MAITLKERIPLWSLKLLDSLQQIPPNTLKKEERERGSMIVRLAKGEEIDVHSLGSILIQS